MHDLMCTGCGQPFQAKMMRAKWCSQACRKRISRGAPPAVPEVDEPPPSALVDSDLVDALRAELASFDRLATTEGQLAIQLARELTAPGATGVAGLSKELRAVKAEALEGTAPPPPAEPPDEVDLARRAREHKTREAARLA